MKLSQLLREKRLPDESTGETMVNQYILIFVWLGFCAIIAEKSSVIKTEVVCGGTVERFPWWFAFVAFVPVIWMAGHRGNVGDTGAYLSGFLNMPDSFAGIPAYAETQAKDPGFYVFSAILKQFIGNHSVRYFTVIAAIQGIILLTVYRKYSSAYIVSLFLFLASTDYISWMYNGIRQFMAVTIIFGGTSLMLRNKYVSLILVILLASLFHQSALIMIPIVLIAQGKAWNTRTLLFIAIIIIAVLFVGRFTSLLDAVLEETQYASVVSDYTSWNDDGTNPIRVLVYSLPAILAFLGRKRIMYEDDQLINLCTNFSLVTAGLYLVSMFTSGIFLGRLPIYTSLYSYILLPWEIENLFIRESKRLMYVAMIVGYLGFYYYQMHVGFRLL